MTSSKDFGLGRLAPPDPSRIDPTNKEKIYDALKRKILDGFFPPGHALRIAALASELKVSQTPVREALNQLEGEGLVDFLPYKGAVVKGLSRAELEEIYDIRTILECAALERAIPNLTAEILAQAADILESIKGVKDPDMLNELNWRFHSLIFGCSEMPILCSMIESLRSRVTRYLRLYYALNAEHFDHDHRTQLEVYARKDIERAVAMRKESVDRVLEVLLRLIPE